MKSKETEGISKLIKKAFYNRRIHFNFTGVLKLIHNEIPNTTVELPMHTSCRCFTKKELRILTKVIGTYESKKIKGKKTVYEHAFRLK